MKQKYTGNNKVLGTVSHDSLSSSSFLFRDEKSLGVGSGGCEFWKVQKFFKLYN